MKSRPSTTSPPVTLHRLTLLTWWTWLPFDQALQLQSECPENTEMFEVYIKDNFEFNDNRISFWLLSSNTFMPGEQSHIGWGSGLIPATVSVTCKTYKCCCTGIGVLGRSSTKGLFLEMQSSAKALPDVFQDAPRFLAWGLERTACANKLASGVMTIFVVVSSPLECEKRGTYNEEDRGEL